MRFYVQGRESPGHFLLSEMRLWTPHLEGRTRIKDKGMGRSREGGGWQAGGDWREEAGRLERAALSSPSLLRQTHCLQLLLGSFGQFRQIQAVDKGGRRREARHEGWPSPFWDQHAGSSGR